MMELAFQIAVAVVILIVILSMTKFRICRIVKPGSPLNGQIVSKVPVADIPKEDTSKPRPGERVWMDISSGSGTAKPIQDSEKFFKYRVFSAKYTNILQILVDGSTYLAKERTNAVDSIAPRFGLMEADSKGSLKTVLGNDNDGIAITSQLGNDTLAVAAAPSNLTPVSVHFVKLPKSLITDRDKYASMAPAEAFREIAKQKNIPSSELVGKQHTTQDYNFRLPYAQSVDTSVESGGYIFTEHRLDVDPRYGRLSYFVISNQTNNELTVSTAAL
jgi:hypothetical protein